MRAAGAVAAGLVMVALAAAAGIWWWSLPGRPASVAIPVNAAAGTLLSSEPFARSLPQGTSATRIRYVTTRAEGAPAVATALVVLPDPLPSGPRPIIAWTHGTTGAAPGCGPSLLAQPFANVPALPEVFGQGWVLVATDYVGLGAPGVASYLIGESEGRAALDAVRAARAMPGVALAGRTVVWGHSQGGHAALWAAQLAARYAPDAGVVGVAAAAPASLPGPLMRAAQDTVVGRIMSAFVLASYTQTYPDVEFDAHVRAGARILVRDMARRCLAGREALVSVLEANLLSSPILRDDPTAGALGRRLDENVPREPIAVPVLVAQGASDDLVLPAIQDSYVRERCAQGQAIDYRRYAGRDHLSLVAADSALVPDLIAWTQARFAGAPAPVQCATTTR